MKVVTPEISWHGRDPLYSVDFQNSDGNFCRLASCGTDRKIRMWQVKQSKDGKSEMEFLSTLSRHSRTVNVVRFSPDGQILASGADDSVILLWRLSHLPPSATLFQEDEEECKETWNVFKQLRSHLEDVYDLSWSSDSLYLLSGSVDNTAILWDVKKGQKLWLFTEHKSFVQGVAFDPLGKFLVTMSSDRVCRVYKATSGHKLLHEIKKLPLPNGKETLPNGKEKSKVFRMFNDDTMKSFFRRLSFSPDGQLLVIPAGCVESSEGETISTTFVFAREKFSRPVMHLPIGNKASLAVRFCPVLFALRKVPRRNPENFEGSEEEWKKYETMFALPYRMVFAVATETSVLLYDTQQPLPLALLSNLHYHTLSDITWSHNGRLLVISSTDGYCTLVTFDENELGTPYQHQTVLPSTPQNQNTTETDKPSVPIEVSNKLNAEHNALGTKTGVIPSAHGSQGSKKEDKHVAVSSATRPSPPVPSQSAVVRPPSTVQPTVSSDGKAPRRVQVTMLVSEPSTSTSAAFCPPSKDKPPKRIQATTLAAFYPPTVIEKSLESQPDTNQATDVVKVQRS